MPAKLPVFDTLLDAFTLWGRNFVYFSLLSLLFSAGLSLIPDYPPDDLLATLGNSEAWPLYLAQTCLLVMLIYAFQFLVTWRCFHKLQKPEPKEARSWLPLAFARFNPALLFYIIFTLVAYPLIRFYLQDYSLPASDGGLVSGGVWGENDFLPQIIQNAPEFVLALVLFFLIPVFVIENPGMLPALRRSLQLGKGNYGAILGLLLLSLVVQSFYGLAFGAIYLFLTEAFDLYGLSQIFSGFPLSFTDIFFWLQVVLILPFDIILCACAYAHLSPAREASAPV